VGGQPAQGHREGDYGLGPWAHPGQRRQDRATRDAAPTEERRKALAKTVHKIAEESRHRGPQYPPEANDRLKALAKDKKVSEDEERRSHDQIQKTTDKFIARVDELLKKKEQEILSF